MSQSDNGMSFFWNVSNYRNRSMPPGIVVLACWLPIVINLITIVVLASSVQGRLGSQSCFDLSFTDGLSDGFQAGYSDPILSLAISVGPFRVKVYILKVRETVWLSAK